MAYLHENKEEFANAVNLASLKYHILPEESVSPSVLVETSFAEVSFPTEILSVHSYIGDLMKTEAPGALEDYFLDTFDMKVQSLDRTLADKVFAICDYYLEDRTAKYIINVK